MPDAEFNFDEFTQGLESLQPHIVEAALQGVDLFGEQLIGNAQEMCPVETGALMGSGTVGRSAKSIAADVPAAQAGDSIVKDVGFNVDYAAARHENPPQQDAPPKINPKGRWKFLEEAIRQLSPKFDRFVGGFVARAMGESGGEG